MDILNWLNAIFGPQGLPIIFLLGGLLVFIYVMIGPTLLRDWRREGQRRGKGSVSNSDGTLQEKNQPALDFLIHLLSDNKTESGLREEAATALGRLCDTRAVEPLLTTVENSSNPDVVRRAAIRALGELGGSGSVSASTPGVLNNVSAGVYRWLCEIARWKTEDLEETEEKSHSASRVA